MRVIDTKWTSAGIKLDIKCWCGGRFCHTFHGRQDRKIECAHCGRTTDFRVLTELAMMPELLATEPTAA